MKLAGIYIAWWLIWIVSVVLTAVLYNKNNPDEPKWKVALITLGVAFGVNFFARLFVNYFKIKAMM